VERVSDESLGVLPVVVKAQISGSPTTGELEDRVHVATQTVMVKWVKHVTGTSVTNLDENPHLNGGKRIMPDKDSPTDLIRHDLIDVEVTVVPTPPVGTTVFLRAFDVDDPNVDADLKLDVNDDRGNGARITTGGDNRGTTPGNRGTFVGAGIAYGTSVTTDAKGKAKATFQVTMQPGDNFRIAAAMTNTELNQLTTFADSEPTGPYYVSANNTQIA
jgi:hypothetical protein